MDFPLPYRARLFGTSVERFSTQGTGKTELPLSHKAGSSLKSAESANHLRRPDAGGTLLRQSFTVVPRGPRTASQR